MTSEVQSASAAPRTPTSRADAHRPERASETPLLLLIACAEPTPSPDSATSDTATVEDTASDTDLAGPPAVHLPLTSLDAASLGIVVNTDDPLSAAIAADYAAAHGIPPEHIVELSLGGGTDLTAESFAVARATLDATFGDDVQALLLTFYKPYRVSCMATSAAFALGFDAQWCQSGPPCRTTAPSPLYDTETVTPWSDHGVRPTMMLSGPSREAAQAVIARGLAAQASYPGPESAATPGPTDVILLRTSDAARSTRWDDMERAAQRFDPVAGLRVTYRDASANPADELYTSATGLLGYQTGLTWVSGLDTVTFAPGALADHLTSFGGVLDGSAGQMPATAWLDAGATASYGTAIEPCNYPQKFPRPTVLWSRYFRGATAVEAYWASVEWPGEGNFVGDPLARPFGHRASWEDGVLTIRTTWPDRRAAYRIEAADSEQGPWETVADALEGGRDHTTHTWSVPDARRAHYRLVAAE